MFPTRECELALYQLRMTFNVLGNAGSGYFNREVPSTVAVTWREVGGDRPLVAGFAASCTGDDKVFMAKVRRKYVEALVNLKKPSPADKNRAPNRAGNCPEFITWSIACRQVGNYQSPLPQQFQRIRVQILRALRRREPGVFEKKLRD
jgi:hypothetical protein